MRYLKKTYKTESSRKRKLNLDGEVTELPRKKRGRPLMLGEELDNRVQELVSEIRDAGGIINTRIVRAVAKGVVIAEDRTLLLENGGTIEITRQWALSLLKRMKMVKRRGSSTAKTEVKNLDELKTNFLSKISEAVEKFKIPTQLIINYDHTGVHLLPVSRWTMAEKGTEKVSIIGLDDKREITGNWLFM